MARRRGGRKRRRREMRRKRMERGELRGGSRTRVQGRAR